MTILINSTTATIVQGNNTYSSIPCQVKFNRVPAFMFDGKPYRGKPHACELSFDKADLTTAGLTAPTLALKITYISGAVVDFRPDVIELKPCITLADGQYYHICCFVGLATAFTNARAALGSQTATIIRGTTTGANLSMGVSGTFSQNSAFSNLSVVVPGVFTDSDSTDGYKENIAGERRFTFYNVVPTTEDRITFGGVDYTVTDIITYPEETLLYTAIGRRL